VAIDVEPGLTAWADGERLEHVVTNLVENAIKFSDSGAITVSGRSVDGWVELSVTDEGIGIEQERLADLFSGPAPAGQRTGPSGTGLGLYLTRLLVEAHGGKIGVDSAAGAGSTFTARIPQERPQ
jgi:signal transduction histidine kinase